MDIRKGILSKSIEGYHQTYLNVKMAVKLVVHARCNLDKYIHTVVIIS